MASDMSDPRFTARYLSEVVETVLSDPNNKIGGNLLGTYDDGMGHIRPAISIGNPGTIKTVKGLEVITPLIPDTEAAGVDSYSLNTSRWDILLIQRDLPPLRSPNLPEAVERLTGLFVQLFNGVVNAVFVDADTLLGSYPQCTFTFSSVEYIDFQRFQTIYAQGL
jgi:hypothetical protein